MVGSEHPKGIAVSVLVRGERTLDLTWEFVIEVHVVQSDSEREGKREDRGRAMRNQWDGINERKCEDMRGLGMMKKRIRKNVLGNQFRKAK